MALGQCGKPTVPNMGLQWTLILDLLVREDTVLK